MILVNRYVYYQEYNIIICQWFCIFYAPATTCVYWDIADAITHYASEHPAPIELMVEIIAAMVCTLS